ncbi:MAG: hypothetical protein JNL98_07395 [Bryobacterales bacterium]|nr:hypothetical protein [Bryobacterales bacterium]
MQPQPGASMKRTPPGGPRIAVAFDEPDEPVSWLRRIAMRLRAMFRRHV